MSPFTVRVCRRKARAIQKPNPLRNGYHSYLIPHPSSLGIGSVLLPEKFFENINTSKRFFLNIRQKVV